MSEKKLINAGIKNEADAAKRMFDGEVFHSSFGSIIYYDGNDYCRFVTKYKNNIEPLNILWSQCTNWKMEKPHVWQDDISKENPILCYVSDDQKEPSKLNTVFCQFVDGFVEEDSYSYKSNKRENFKYATPVLIQDIYTPKDEK